MCVRERAVLLILLCAIMSAGPQLLGVSNAEEKATVAPAQVAAGTFQKIRFEFTAGSSGIATSGGVRLELPTAYLETAPYYWDRPQIEVPEARGYVTARASGDADIRTKIYGASGGIVECSVARGSVQPGERIVVDYAGIVQSNVWDVFVRVEWRKTAGEPWKALAKLPRIEILPQKAATMVVVAPADVTRDGEFDLAVVLLDKFGNAASGYRGLVLFSSTDTSASLPRAYEFTEKDSGVHVFKGVKYKNAGFQRISARDGSLAGRGNYSAVWESAPTLKRYFGDTHFHTGSGTGNKTFSVSSGGGDHRGHFTTMGQAYKYARDVMRLDFASAAEHDGQGMNDTIWEKCEEITDSFNAPGRFATLFAYEWTAAPAVGHHVVVYKERGGKVLSQAAYGTTPDLYRALARQGKAALVIPHCTWAQPDHKIWDAVNNDYGKIGELYSLWNNRFLLQPGDEPQRFELGVDNRWSYQYAWHKGHKIGVIGSSDNHTGRPGVNNYTVEIQHAGGLAVAVAKEGSREGIWDAFQNRHTYATTGTRIYMDFTSDGHLMGDEYTASKPPRLAVKVAGTNKIQTVEIVKHDSKGYTTIVTRKPESEMCTFEVTDDEFKEDSFYYVRVAQVDEFPRGAWAYPSNEMAWSSPIWVKCSR